MLKHLISQLNAGQTCCITLLELETMFPAVVDDGFLLKVKPILVSSEDRFKIFCLENKYFYKYDFNNNSYLVSK